MAYSKRVPSIKMVLNVEEYNNLIGVFTKNIEESNIDLVKEIACMTKEKLLKYSIPRKKEDDSVEIDIKLYINEATDIISQLLTYVGSRIENVDYYQVLLKIYQAIGSTDN